MNLAVWPSGKAGNYKSFISGSNPNVTWSTKDFLFLSYLVNLIWWILSFSVYGFIHKVPCFVTYYLLTIAWYSSKLQYKNTKWFKSVCGEVLINFRSEKINVAKSSMSLSPSQGKHTHRRILGEVGFVGTPGMWKYLGIPIHWNRLHEGLWEFVSFHL